MNPVKSTKIRKEYIAQMFWIACRKRSVRIWRNCLFLLISLSPFLLISPSHAQDDRELWVPTEHLEAVLEKMPRAVFLTPQQYDRLRTDFKKANLDRAQSEIQPPVPATIRSASIVGTVEPGASVVSLTATYEVESFTDGWTEVPLLLPADHLGHVAIDEQSAIRSGPKQPTTLLTSGRGIHTVAAVYHLPVERSPGGNAITLTAPGVPAKVALVFPADAEVESPLPFVREEESSRVVFALPSAAGTTHEIRWSAQKVPPIPGAAVLQTCSYVYNLESTNIRADLGLVVSSNLTELPRRFTVRYPADFRVLSVDGSELLRWTSKNPGELETFLLPGERDAADLRILLERDLDDSGDITVDLPVATISGVHRASGTFTLIGSEDVRVKTIETGALTAPIPDDVEGGIAVVPHYVASFSFPVSNKSPRVTLSPVQSRFQAQIDTLVTLRREHIAIERTLSILPQEGSVFHIDLALPADEEFTDAVSDRDDFTWKRLDDGALRLLWEKGTRTGGSADVTVTTRRDPEGWYTLGQTPATLDFAPASIDGAEAVSGYLAVAFDPSFSVETVASGGLEIRDARTTPVTGTLAWFRLEDFSLSLASSRRPPEIEAAVTAYVLPLANTIELEGQLDLTIRYSGIAEIDVTLPPEVAPLFRFTSPLIAEQTLLPDDAGWRLRFHQERKEFTRLPFRAVLPVGESDADAEDGKAETFTATLPRPGVPAARRLQGHWIVEANTDTELHFAAAGLDRIDSLRVPAVAGYEPRHRIIAAYHYRGDEGSLTLSGTRHEHAESATTVVDSLRLDTVASTDGTERHQARLAVRSSGEQFLELALPADAVLLTLLVDEETVKPVSAGERSLRVQLPADKEGGTAVNINLIYQTPGEKWGGSGSETLAPIELDPGIPVMATEWYLHLPEGYDYQRFESNLGQEFEVVDRLLLGAAGETFESGLDAVFPRSFAEAFVKNSEGGWTNHSPLSEDATESPSENTEMAPRKRGGPAGYEEGKSGIPTVSSHYVIRLQERVKKADEAALRGSQLMADGDYQGSVDQYRNSMDLLPDAPMTEPRYRAYVKQFARASTLLAKDRANEGRYPEAIALIEEVLQPSVDFDNIDAKRLLEQLNDPDYYSPALTPSHLERVRRVKLALKTGTGYIDLGDYDRADREYHKALSEDPYNVAARMGQEKNERHRMNYYDAAYNHTRAKMLRQVAAGWESPVPGGLDAVPSGSTDSSMKSIRGMEEKLKTIIIPSMEFADTPLRDALDFLQQRSVELDVYEANPAKKGLKITLDSGMLDGAVGDTRITLRLGNVPLGEALRYTTSLANLRYKLGSQAITVVPLSAPDTDLYTNTFTVPPTFLSAGNRPVDGPVSVDPFADPADPVEVGNGAQVGRQTAKDILESAGITFGVGSSAIYNPVTSELIVRNTQDQMELVEAYNESLSATPHRIEKRLLPTDMSTTNIARIEDKLKSIIIPSVEFADMPLKNALEFIQQRSVERDTNESDPAKKGINIILDAGVLGAAAGNSNDGDPFGGGMSGDAAAGNSDDGFGFAGGSRSEKPGSKNSVADTPITLRLSNVPLAEALRYTTSLANLKYKVEPHAIIVLPLSQPDADLFTNVYNVPPTFLSSFDQIGNGGAAAADPFADPGDSGGGLPMRRSAKGILESAGISFGTGSSVIYNSATGQLIVRNTQDQMELVEASIESIGSAPSPEEPLPEGLFPTIDDISVVGRAFEKNAELGAARTDALSRITLENLDFENLTLTEAARTLNERLAEAAPGQFPAAAVVVTSTDTDGDGTIDPLADGKLGITLSKVTALEALDRITRATNTQYRVTASGIVIDAANVSLEPMESIFLPLPQSEFQRVGDSGEVQGMNARTVLTEIGIRFPVGASAVYNPGTGRLAVRNNQANLEAVVAHYSDLLAMAAGGAGDAFPADAQGGHIFTKHMLGGAENLRGFDYRDAGKRPLAFALPESGRSYRFAGLYAPEPVSFRFVDWERQIRFAWIWMLVGGLIYWFGARGKLNRPVFLGLAGIIVFTFLPLLVSKGLTEFCNALLLGWLVAMAIAVIVKVSRKVVNDEG